MLPHILTRAFAAIQLFAVLTCSVPSRAQEKWSTYYHWGECDKAIKGILANYDKTDMEMNYALGECAMRTGDWLTAKMGYLRVVVLRRPIRCDTISARTIEGFQNRMSCAEYNNPYWTSHDGLGVVYYKLGDTVTALRHFNEALKWCEHDPSSTTRAILYYNLACIYSATRNLDKAFKYFKMAVYANSKYRQKAANDPDLTNLKKLDSFNLMLRQ